MCSLKYIIIRNYVHHYPLHKYLIICNSSGIIYNINRIGTSLTQAYLDDDDDGDSDNFMVRLGHLKSIYDQVSKIIDVDEINLTQIAKNQDLNELQKLTKLIVTVLISKDDLCVLFVQEMSDHDRLEFAKFMGFNQIEQSQPQPQPSRRSNSIILDQNFILNKLEEYESNISQLQQKLRECEEQKDIQCGEAQHQIKSLTTLMVEKETNQGRRDEEVNEFFESVGCSSFEEVILLLEKKDQELREFGERVMELESEVQRVMMERSSVVEEQKRHNEQLQKRINNLQRVEMQNEQLQDRLNQQQYAKKDEQIWNQQRTELQAKLDGVEAKMKKYKGLYTETNSQKCHFEFECKKLGTELRSTQMQIEQRERQIGELNVQLSELEREMEKVRMDENKQSLHQTLMQQGIGSIQNSFVIPQFENSVARRRMTIAEIMTPRRNLGAEMTSFLQKSQEEIVIRSLKSARQTKVVESSDEESDQSDFWKSKAEGLLKDVEKLEEKIALQQYGSKQMENNINRFFLLQEKYQQDLVDAKNQLVCYTQELEEKERMLETMRRCLNECEMEKEEMFRNVLKDSQVIEELSKRMTDYEGVMSRGRSKREEEKSLKKLRERHCQELERKEEQIRLLIGAMLEIQNGVMSVVQQIG